MNGLMNSNVMFTINHNILYFFIISLFATSQNTKKIKILDSITLDPIPYSTIHFSNSDNKIIADYTGYFELIKSNYDLYDTIFINTIGYKEASYNLDTFISKFPKDSLIIYLSENPIGLDNIYLTTKNKNYTSKEIVDEIEKRIKYNYSLDLREKKLFYKEEVNSTIDEIEISDFKSSIKEINSTLLDSFFLNYRREFYNEEEVLCNFYGNFEEKTQKINIIKARETFEKNNDIVKALNTRLENIIKENVKSDSYFKIRSGVFSRKIDTGLIKEKVDTTNINSYRELTEKKLKENFSKSKKNNINKIYSEVFFNNSSELTIIRKKNRYVFSEPELIFIDGELMYVLSFHPKRLELYKGKIYVNPDNFAIVRIDFNNIKSLFKFKLLGVYADRYLKSGKIIFSKNKDDKYELSYYQSTSSMRNGAKRPLKIIEKNKYVKGRRKQNQVSFDINLKVDITIKRELKLIISKPINEINYNNVKEENNVLPEYFESFVNTNYWDNL